MIGRHDFLIDPSISYLNHGSIGGLPRAIHEERIRILEYVESQPYNFFLGECYTLLKSNKEAMAAFLQCNSRDVVFDLNVTAAINVMARSLPLKEGDNLIMTDLEYNPTMYMWRRLAEQRGFTITLVEVPVPYDSDQTIIDNFEEGITSETKALYFSHIISPGGIILPAEELVRLGHQHGLVVCIDGAHVPGQLPLNVTTLGADMYSGNLHKWVNTPKSVGFLYANESIQDRIEPTVFTQGAIPLYDGLTPYEQRFFYSGTRDYSPFFCIEKSIDFMEEQGWEAYQKHGHEIVRYALERLNRDIGFQPFYDVDSNFYWMMATCFFPSELDPFALRNLIWEEQRVEVMIDTCPKGHFIRVSGNLYNDYSDVDRLIEALKKYL